MEIQNIWFDMQDMRLLMLDRPLSSLQFLSSHSHKKYFVCLDYFYVSAKPLCQHSDDSPSLLSAVARQDLIPHPSLGSPSFLPLTPTMSEATAWPQQHLPVWRTNLASTCPNSSLPAWFPSTTRSQSPRRRLRPHRGLNLHITLPSLSSSRRSQTP